MKYVVFDKATGQITKVVTAPNLQFAMMQVADSEDLLQTEDSTVSDSTCYVANGLLTAFPEKPSMLHVWDWESLSWADPNLDTAKAAAWEAIKLQRGKVEKGGFEWSGYKFDSDAVSQQRIQGAVQLAQMALAANVVAWSIDWTLFDNSVVTLDATDMVNVGLALGMHVSTVFNISRELREQIYSASTLQSLNTIKWPV